MKYKLIILDRDGLLLQNSTDSTSKFYYILKKEDCVLLPNVKEVMAKLQEYREQGLKVVLASKQRCIGKELITLDEVQEINRHIEELIDFKFDQVFLEIKSAQKLRLFGEILNTFNIHPNEILIVDDRVDNTVLASILGCRALHTENLSDILPILEQKEV